MHNYGSCKRCNIGCHNYEMDCGQHRLAIANIAPDGPQRRQDGDTHATVVCDRYTTHDNRATNMREPTFDRHRYSAVVSISAQAFLSGIKASTRNI